MDIIRVFVVDDHSLFRNGLKLLLNTSPNIRVVGEAENGRQFIDCLPACLADVVLMDIDMPVMDGITATREALLRYPDLKVVTLSMFGEEEYYFRMIDAGARGFLLKNSDITEVRNAIQNVMDGRTYFSEELLLSVVKNIRTAGASPKHSANLSDREVEVLQQICLGLPNQEIAEVLHISKRTVDKHRANLLEKTNSRNTANLVIFAMKHKLVEM